ncbi:ATP-binding cassette domain-containing protein [Microtetraspora malaysiensis]|uniref:ATP-binding cassette domain-containing protein n=1 Tax=Microtetraspora malaysiensis TaxID=161358 RepID=A0ABW6SM52_9ACTN
MNSTGRTEAGYPVTEIEMVDPYSCWRVVSGSVDVLLVPLDGDGRRHRVLRAEAGDIVHGFAATDLPGGYTVRIAGIEGAAVRRVHRDRDAVASWARRVAALGASGGAGGSGGSDPDRRAPASEGVSAPADDARLRVIHRRALADLLLRADAEDADRDNWRRARAAASGEAFRQACADIAVAAGAPPTLDRPGTDREHAAEVVRAIGAHCGFAAPNPPDQAGDPLTAALDAARARHRRVRLEGRWWRDAAVPMIGFLREGGRPVALIPGRDGYRIADPTAEGWPRVGRGTRTERVDAARAAALAEEAWQIYPPLESGITSAAGLLRYGLRGSGRELAALVGAGAAAALLALGVPLLTFRLLSAALTPGDRPMMLWTVGLIVSLVVSGALLLAVRNALLVRVQGRIQERLEPAVWSHLLSLDLRFIGRYGTGELVQRANAVADMRRALGEAAVNSLLGGVFSALGLLVLLLVDWRLAAASLAGVALLLAALAACAVRQQRHELVVHEQYGKVYSLLYSCLSAIDKIHVAGREVQVFGLWARLFAAQQRAEAAALRERARAAAVGLSAQPLLLFLVAAVGLALDMPASSLVVAAVALGQFVLALGQMHRAVEAGFALLPRFERLRPLLEQPPETPPGAKDPGELSGLVRLRSVTFAYPGTTTQILDDVSMVFRPGEFVAVVGQSGAGKSTIVRILLGFDVPRAGQVLYGGSDLRDLDLRRVRAQVGVVMQQARVLRGTLMENILGDVPGATEGDAWWAARLAGLDDDIARLPMGMHTVVSEDNTTFSGGQLQRLLIARALVKRPRVLILDEATSALDNVTQSLVSRRVAELDVTRIVIAHRLSTIRSADRIYVLDQGRVAADGTFDELVSRNELFTRMVRRQEV